jgi:hypothetical protein
MQKISNFVVLMLRYCNSKMLFLELNYPGFFLAGDDITTLKSLKKLCLKQTIASDI